MRSDERPAERPPDIEGWATRQLHRVVSALIARQAMRLSQCAPMAGDTAARR